MRKLKTWLKLRQFERILKITTGILSIVTIIGLIKSTFIKFRIPLVDFVVIHLYWFWVISVTLAIIMLILTTIRLQRRFSLGFKDKFKGDLDKNWDYQGEWTKPYKGVLCVKGSDVGGITKTGSLWENYAFEFDTCIQKDCTSWIIRAQDLNNYYMFQCRKDIIRPHRRVTILKFKSPEDQPSKDSEKKEIQVIPEIGWQIWDGVPHNKDLKGWFHVRIEVKGESVWIFINSELVLHLSSLIKNPTGKVGFRNSGNEEAHFRNIQVSLFD